MDFNLKAPPALKGSEREQLAQIKSYLHQMQQLLVVALDGMNPDVIASKAAAAVRGNAKLPEGAETTVSNAYTALKSMIVKTADTIQEKSDEITQLLERDYVANSTFGIYQEEARAQMMQTATGVLQQFNYDAKISDVQTNVDGVATDLGALASALATYNNMLSVLENYNIKTQQYIYAGLLYFDQNNVPRYGVAVGEDMTTIEVNGQVVLERSGLAATFTSDRLSFWQNDVEVAWISDNQLYINEAHIISRLFIGKWVIDTTYGFTLKWVGI